ncbi:hypothetical protein [Streptomyces sp. NPDC046821]|uniref:hypothetical protein n=1 Tax=Streptomyces sp. NPDC046821 TaxID=3154702 RepID=UPI0033DD965F
MNDVASQISPCAASTCHRELRDYELAGAQHICSPCTTAIHTWLHEIPLQMIVLGGSRQRETTGTPGPTGTRTPPLPGRDDVLNLVGPAAWTTVHDPYGDQHGPIPIVGTLGQWVRIICEERRWNGPDTVTAETLAAWLAEPRRLDWACRQPWAGEMRDELYSLMRTIRGITRLRPQRRPIPQPCPRCDSLTLTETDHQLYVDCGTCDSLFTRSDLALGAAATAARVTAEQLNVA